jgi:acyl-homoserine lactone acylase PvdQ
VQGRLSQVLGPNFIERDAMTRRVQYRGDMDAEWDSYGADTKAIVTSFVRGINAWVALARARPPEEFLVAGWTPDFWSPIDLLNRTDAFRTSGDAIDEVRRTHLSDVVADALRRVGTPPFFVALAAPVRDWNPSPSAELEWTGERDAGRPAEIQRRGPGTGSSLVAVLRPPACAGVERHRRRAAVAAGRRDRTQRPRGLGNGASRSRHRGRLR